MATVKERKATQLRLQMLEARLKRQQAEIRRLEADSEAHKNLFNVIGAAIFVLDPQHHFLDINKAAADLLGTTAEALRGRHCWSVMHAADAPPSGCPLTAVTTTGRYATSIMYVERLDRYLWVCCTPMLDNAGKVERVIHVADDITEEIQLRDRVTASEKRLRTILDALPDMILETDTELRIIWANRAALVEKPDVIGTFCSMTPYPDGADPSGETCICQKALDTGEMADRIYYHPGTPTTPGETWWHNIGIPLKDSQGKITGLIKFSRNITEDMIAKRNLEASERQFRLLAENCNDLIWTLGPDARLIYVNPAVERILGYRPEELVNQPISMLLPPEDHQKAMAELQRFLAQLEAGECDESPVWLELAHRCRDGRTVITEMVVTKVFDQRGAFRFFTGISRDITKRQLREEALQRANKLEAVGVLAGGLAHDFNNLLSIILGNLEMTAMSGQSRASSSALCLEAPDFVEQMDPHLQAAREATLRARELTHQLLAFAKGGDPVKKSTQIEPIIEAALSRICPDERVVTRVEVAPDLNPIAVDRLQMGRAIGNIIQNAVEAMPDGGELSISVQPHRLSGRDAAALPSDNGSRYIKMTISDQGCGISKAIQAQIFDPYFSTKPLGAKKGLGLGLTLAYAVIKRHGGWIDVDSVEGQGSCFTILLPMGAEPGPTYFKRLPAAATQRILLMDDEEQLRILCEQMLKHLGYEVKSVTDGHAAVSAYRQAMDAGNPFGMVILDLTVKSGMGGKDALRELRRLDPDVLAVVSSGYNEDPVMTDPLRFGFTTVLPKPYALKELSAVVEKILPKPPQDT